MVLKQLIPARPAAKRLAVVVGCAGLAAGLAPPSVLSAQSGKSARAASRTIGFVVTNWYNGFVLTPDAAECSLGVQKGEPLQARAQPGFEAYIRQFGGSYETRGPNGEMGSFNPDVVKDPLPWSELTTKTGYGLNLDGTQDGRATAKTCRHEKFTSPEGEMVDHQMARAIGCVKGYRGDGNQETNGAGMIVTSPVMRRLLEITGVDDERNDPEVTVTFYKGRDGLRRTGNGQKWIADQSIRVDYRFPQYISKARGKIVDGVLTTEPFRLVVPTGNVTFLIGEVDMEGTRLRLKMNGEDLSGVVAGYQDIDLWYMTHAKGVTSGLSQYNSSSIHKALYRFADGYPDPKTGQCTRISTTYRMTGLRAMIVHSEQRDRIKGIARAD